MQNVRKNDPNWYTVYGMHASGEAVNTQLTTSEENMAIYKIHFTDDINMCSRAPFNMYFILQAIGNILFFTFYFILFYFLILFTHGKNG